MLSHSYSLQGTEIQNGISGVTGTHALFLKLGALHLPFRYGPKKSFPQHDNGMLYQAVPVVISGRIHGLSGGFPSLIRLVAIDVASLEFKDGFEIPRRRETILWPGGEGVYTPFAQSGHRAGVDKLQLFAVQADERLLVIDRYSRIMILQFQEDGCKLRPATKEDLLRHLFGRAMAARNLPEVIWVLRVLNTMGWQEHGDFAFVKAQTLKPDFRIDWNSL